MIDVAAVVVQMVSTSIGLRSSLMNWAEYAIYHLIVPLPGAIVGVGLALMNLEMRGMMMPMLSNDCLTWVDTLRNFDIWSDLKKMRKSPGMTSWNHFHRRTSICIRGDNSSMRPVLHFCPLGILLLGHTKLVVCSMSPVIGHHLYSWGPL